MGGSQEHEYCKDDEFSLGRSEVVEIPRLVLGCGQGSVFSNLIKVVTANLPNPSVIEIGFHPKDPISI